MEHTTASLRRQGLNTHSTGTTEVFLQTGQCAAQELRPAGQAAGVDHQLAEPKLVCSPSGDGEAQAGSLDCSVG